MAGPLLTHTVSIRRRDDENGGVNHQRFIEEMYRCMTEEQLRGEISLADKIELRVSRGDGVETVFTLHNRPVDEREAIGGWRCVIG